MTEKKGIGHCHPEVCQGMIVMGHENKLIANTFNIFAGGWMAYWYTEQADIQI